MYLQNENGFLKQEVENAFKNNKEVYVRYVYWQFKGDNKKYKTYEEIFKACNNAEWAVKRIMKKYSTTDNYNTAKKYTVVSISY